MKITKKDIILIIISGCIGFILGVFSSYLANILFFNSSHKLELFILNTSTINLSNSSVFNHYFEDDDGNQKVIGIIEYQLKNTGREAITDRNIINNAYPEITIKNVKIQEIKPINTTYDFKYTKKSNNFTIEFTYLGPHDSICFSVYYTGIYSKTEITAKIDTINAIPIRSNFPKFLVFIILLIIFILIIIIFLIIANYKNNKNIKESNKNYIKIETKIDDMLKKE